MINKAIKINYTAVSDRMNKHRILMLVLMTVVVFVMGPGVGEASDVNMTFGGNYSSLAFISAVSGADIGLELANNESHIPDSRTLAQNTIGNDSYDILITDEFVSQNSLYPTLNEIYEETENQEVIYLKDGYTITIADINKYTSSYEMLLVLEKNSIELDNKVVCSGEEYSWHNANNSITSNVEIFVGTSMDVVFFKNVYQISNGNTIVDNETFTIIYSREISESLNLNTADYKNIEGFTTSNENMVQSSSFPPASGYSQEFLKENYSLTVLELDVDGNEAWILLSNDSGEVDSTIVSVGTSYNYNSILSFKIDKVFAGTSRNYIEITNIYQYSEIDSNVIVENESALLLQGSTGKFILTGGGLEWQLEENYKLHAIDIDTAGYSREALLLITKDGTHVDYTIINVSDSYTYYEDENLILTADVETIFSGEGESPWLGCIMYINIQRTLEKHC